MPDPSGLVHQVRMAILSRYTGDCEWVDDKTMLRVDGDPANQGLTPVAIKQRLQTWVSGGGAISCKHEDRANWKDKREFVYWVVIQEPGFPRGLFVELELLDPDPTDPRVVIVNAHPASI
jgi:hypothetical protein